MSPSIAVASRKASEQIREWLTNRGIERVTEPVHRELVERFSTRKLRQALRECGLPLDPIVEGVRQDSLQELARTLVALQHEYQSANDRVREQRIRAMVIESKTHARFAALKHPAKLEMVEWMLVWLNDPSLFETWVKLRLRSLAESGSDEVAGPHAGQTDEH